MVDRTQHLIVFFAALLLASTQAVQIAQYSAQDEQKSITEFFHDFSTIFLGTEQQHVTATRNQTPPV